MNKITKKQKKNSREYAERKKKINKRYNRNIRDYRKLLKLKNNIVFRNNFDKFLEQWRKEYIENEGGNKKWVIGLLKF